MYYSKLFKCNEMKIVLRRQKKKTNKKYEIKNKLKQKLFKLI